MKQLLILTTIYLATGCGFQNHSGSTFAEASAEEFISVCDRGPYMKALLEQKFRRPCEMIFEVDVRATDELDDYHGNGMRILSGDLQGFGNLNSIEFRYISEVPSDLLKGKPKLNLVFIVGGDLTNIPEGFFSSLSTPVDEQIDIMLRDNSLTELPEDFYSAFRNRTRFSVYLSGNPLSEITIGRLRAEFGNSLSITLGDNGYLYASVHVRQQ